MEEGSPVFSHLYSSPLTHEVAGEMTDVDELDYQSERRALKLLLEKSNWVDIRWKSAHCNITNFLDAYTTCKIMHFTGHGEQGVLAFENNFGMLQWVSHEEVTEMCRGLGDSAAGRPEVVFISACYGLTSAQAFVDLGIPHVVSVTAERVLDRASLEFTDAFYSGLFSGKTVAAAFQLGLARLVAQYPSEKDKFRLLGAGGREGQDHDVTLFGSRAAPLARPHFDAAASTLPSSQCYSSANFSLGRLVPMQEVYGLLQNGIRLINLTGPRGVGKTEVALKVAEYARERYRFSRFLFVDFSKMGNECSERACLEKLVAAFVSSSSSAGGEGAGGGGGGGDIIDEAVERIRRHLQGQRGEEEALLVLDGLDTWMTPANGRRDFMQRLVTQLRQGLGQAVALLLTSSARLAADTDSRVIRLEGLSDRCAANLFAIRAPRQLESDELYLDANHKHDPLKAFSKSKLLQSMKGNCKVIELVAKELQFDGSPQHLLRYQTYFREEIIPSVSFQVEMGDSPPTWTSVQHQLSAKYRHALGIEQARARPFTPQTFQYFASCPAWAASAPPSVLSSSVLVPAQNGYKIAPLALQSFLAWFEELLQALKRSALWGRPHCIFGFISRQDAAALLGDSEVGTFLIGVSQSEACLVINVVTSPGKVLPVKVKFNADSPDPFSFDMKHGMTTSFPSLENLIKSNAQLLYFYPSFPLENGNKFINKELLLP